MPTLQMLAGQFPNRYKRLYEYCKKHEIEVNVSADSGKSWGMPPVVILGFPAYGETCSCFWGNPFENPDNDVLPFIVEWCKERETDLKARALLIALTKDNMESPQQ